MKTQPPEEDSNAGIPSVLRFGAGQRGFLFLYLTDAAFDNLQNIVMGL